MFEEDGVFEEWLDKRASEVFGKMSTGEPVGPEDMNILVLKAQANHFVHLDRELRGEMKALREDMDKRFEAVDRRFEEMRKDMDKRFASTQWLIGTGIALLAAMIAVFQFLQ